MMMMMMLMVDLTIETKLGFHISPGQCGRGLRELVKTTILEQDPPLG